MKETFRPPSVHGVGTVELLSVDAFKDPPSSNSGFGRLEQDEPEHTTLHGTWVARWLTRYCAPGTHTFAGTGPGEQQCSRCRKFELQSGVTCLICELPGSRPCLLKNSGSQAPSLSGLICGPCHDDFLEAETILEWTIEETDQSQTP